MKNEKKRIMKILVAGCGKIGVSVISRLVDEGHDVTALDSSAAVVGGITNVYDVIGAVGNATDCETLAEAVGATPAMPLNLKPGRACAHGDAWYLHIS